LLVHVVSERASTFQARKLFGSLPPIYDSRLNNGLPNGALIVVKEAYVCSSEQFDLFE
jgi:hypothetical protein